MLENYTIHFSGHSLEKMRERGILREEVVHAIKAGESIKEYAEDKPFPSRLMLGGRKEVPIHVVIGVDTSHSKCFVVTAYRPDLEIWNPDLRTRRNP